MINIVSCVDERFLQHYTVMLASIIAYTDPKILNCYLLIDSVKQIWLEKVKTFASQNNIIITIIDIRDEKNKLDNLAVWGHISLATWYRLLIPSLVPIEEKILYLDVDIVLLDSIDKLYSNDVSYFAVAAVTDCSTGGRECYAKLGLKSYKDYFNAGVLLINLEFWRRYKVAEKCMEFARDNPSLISHFDQCALNYILEGMVYYLDNDWNYHSRWQENTLGFSRNPMKQKKPNLVHFAGPFKPWHYMDQLEFGDEYWKYLKNTPWSDYVPPDKTPINILKKFLKKLLPVSVRIIMRKYF